MDRRAFLKASALGILGACSRGGGSSTTGPSTDFGPDPKVFKAIGTTPDAGFFSLRAYQGALYCGTYGTPRVYKYNGSSFSEVGGIGGAGESCFDLGIVGGQLFAATENRGLIYRLDGGSFREVFRAGERWDNSYSMVDYNGSAVTGFNEYNATGGRRTLVCMSKDGGARWDTHVLDGYHSARFGVLGMNLYASCLKTGGSVTILRYEGGAVWRPLVGGLGPFPGKLFSTGAALLFGTESGSVYEFDGTTVRTLYTLGDKMIPQVILHRGSRYAVAGAEWHASRGNARLYREKSLVAEFGEPEGWCVESYNGRIYVGTRRDGGGGKVYEGDS